jgi:hypothetical protein
LQQACLRLQSRLSWSILPLFVSASCCSTENVNRVEKCILVQFCALMCFQEVSVDSRTLVRKSGTDGDAISKFCWELLAMGVAIVHHWMSNLTRDGSLTVSQSIL